MGVQCIGGKKTDRFSCVQNHKWMDMNFWFFPEEETQVFKCEWKQSSWRCAKGSMKSYSHPLESEKEQNVDTASTVRRWGRKDRVEANNFTGWSKLIAFWCEDFYSLIERYSIKRIKEAGIIGTSTMKNWGTCTRSHIQYTTRLHLVPRNSENNFCTRHTHEKDNIQKCKFFVIYIE